MLRVLSLGCPLATQGGTACSLEYRSPGQAGCVIWGVAHGHLESVGGLCVHICVNEVGKWLG